MQKETFIHDKFVKMKSFFEKLLFSRKNEYEKLKKEGKIAEKTLLRIAKKIRDSEILTPFEKEIFRLKSEEITKIIIEN